MEPNIITVNSCSGGKTSSVMYLDHPTDETIFAVVTSNSPENKFRDKGVAREVKDRLPWCEGSMELEATIKAMLQLEQLGGRKITWVASEWSYEQLVLGESNIPGKQIPYLPNKAQRFCTEWLKIHPIFSHAFAFWLPYGEILMNIGFRADEAKRVLKYDDGCKLNKITYSDRCDIAGKYSGRHRWVKNFWWREINFPLYQNGITKEDVQKRIDSTGIIYPEISNCALCFFHLAEQQRRQAELYPHVVPAWTRLEDKASEYHHEPVTFDKKASIREILAGKDNNPGVSGCMCTD